MKKIFTLLVAAALMATMAAVSMAAAPGDIVYKEDDDDYVDAGNTLIPGKDYYLVLTYEKDSKNDPAYSTSSSEKPKSIKWDTDTLDVEDPYEEKNYTGSKAKKYLSLSSSATRIKIDGTTASSVWAAKLEPKRISASSYDEGYEFSGDMTYKIDGKDYSHSVSVTIEYDEGGNEFEKNELVFEFERNDDVDIDFPDGDGRLTGTANRDFKLIAAMNTDHNSTISNKYPSANLYFYNGNGANLTYIRNARLHFEAGSDQYLYEITSGNELTDLTSTYNSSTGEFVVSARSLGKYVLSDRQLNASSSASSSGSSSSGGSSTTGSSSGSTGAGSLSSLQNLISRNFSNKFVLLSYGTEYGVMNKAQTFSVSVNLTGMNTSDLYLYTYDAANNRLIGSANRPKVAANGALTFVTNTKGYYVVSSGQLSK